MDAAWAGSVVWIDAELPCLLKPQLILIHIRRVDETVLFGRLVEIYDVPPFVVVLISEVIDAPRAEPKKLHEHLVKKLRIAMLNVEFVMFSVEVFEGKT